MPTPICTDGQLEGLKIIEPAVFTDDRGLFFESYNDQLFASFGITTKFVQDNHSISKKGVLRGLHFQQTPHTQAKLVRVATGAAYDVVVDIRQKSDTFGKWIGIELSAENKKMLYIPEGFAHGFYALQDNTTFLYKCSAIYNPQSEGGINALDSELAIVWPSDSSGMTPILSAKDASYPRLSQLTSPF